MPAKQSKQSATDPDDRYEAQNDATGGDVPSGDVKSSDYVDKGPLPVQSDDAPVEDPIDPAKADTDAQLGKHHLHLLPLPPRCSPAAAAPPPVLAVLP